MVPPFAVPHLFAKHGQAGTEPGRGQKPVVAVDYRLLTLVLDDRDSVLEDAGRLVFEKTINGERIVAVLERRMKRRMISSVTMWIVG